MHNSKFSAKSLNFASEPLQRHGMTCYLPQTRPRNCLNRRHQNHDFNQAKWLESSNTKEAVSGPGVTHAIKEHLQVLFDLCKTWLDLLSPHCQKRP